MTWKESLKDIGIFPAASSVLRHGLTQVPISRIAKQYYCELKVDHEFTLGEMITPVTELGEELHQGLIENAMPKASPEQLVESIETAEAVVASFRLVAKVGGLPIVGFPDAIVFSKSKPLFVIELKTTQGDIRRVFRDQVVQAKLYGLALDHMSFDCSSLRLVVARWRQDSGITQEERDLFMGSVVKALLAGEISSLENEGNLKLHLYDYDYKDALKDLDWAKDYWLSKRAPVPTRQGAKCRVCEYCSVCPSSLFRL